MDFKKLLTQAPSPRSTDPVALFAQLVRGPGIDYLRTVQQEVLNEWGRRRSERDLIIKMNTGAGKTLVGLLLLQASLNEGVGPALYLCATDQLVEQLDVQARDYGIDTVGDPGGGKGLPSEFLNGTKILITSFHSFFNGMSRFGVTGGRHQPCDLGALVVDDAHTCLHRAREKTSLQFPRNKPAYEKLVALFDGALRGQSQVAFAHLEQGLPGAIMAVPYWAWSERQSEVASIVTEDRDNPDVKFALPLLQDDLAFSHCLVSSERILVTPHVVPLHRIPSFGSARRRIFLSATLVDDSALIRDFGVGPGAVQSPIRPAARGDIGERLIIAPDVVEPELERQAVVDVIKRYVAQGFNTVVLVPSEPKAKAWVSAGATLPKGETQVTQLVDKLRTGGGNFVVFMNRYDGIDLPGNVCRLLVLDGLPTGGLMYEQYQLNVRPRSTQLRIQMAQRIEQGLGRGVRSQTDQCAVLLLGLDLAQFVARADHQQYFSPETRKQIQLGIDLCQKMKAEGGNAQTKLRDALAASLRDDPDWRAFHRATLAEVTAASSPTPPLAITMASAEREAAARFRANAATEASQRLQKAIGEAKDALDDDDRGWFLQIAAMLVHPDSPGDAQAIQRKAHEVNPNVLRPIAGATYRRLQAKAGLQGTRVRDFIQTLAGTNAIPIFASQLLSGLQLEVMSHTFEEAVKDLGRFIGFESQRPEWELGVGPDALWDSGEYYFVIEVKNEVLESRDFISKDEVGQLSNSVNWFRQEYPDKSFTPVLIHPASTLHRTAHPPQGTRILTKKGLATLHARVHALAAALAQRPPSLWSAQDVGGLIGSHKLTAGALQELLVEPETGAE